MFITLEGIEGSGKTTQVSHIVSFLTEKGHECVVTREPGGTDIGGQIRAILLNPGNKRLDPLAELLLYAADRAQHIKTVISPSLLAGKTVICDRFFDATTAYQGYARKIDMTLINTLHKLVLDDLEPDMTFLFDLPVKTGLSRAWEQIDNGSRSDLETRFEKEDIAFHEKVRSGYLKLSKQYPHRFQIIDASKEIDQVKNDILHSLSLHLN